MYWEQLICCAFLLTGGTAWCAELVVHRDESNPARACTVQAKELPTHGHLRALQVIEDPGTHRRWVVERNREHPERPALLVGIADADPFCPASTDRMGGTYSPGGLQQFTPIVNRGDALVVVDDGRTWHAEIKAVALSNGRHGEDISVRLQVVNRVVRVRISAPGLAVLNVEGAGVHR